MTSKFPFRSIWHYLETKGILENGTDTQIAAAKKEYYKLYNKHYLRNYRQENVQVTLQFKRGEYDRIKLIAQSLESSVQYVLKEKLKSSASPETNNLYGNQLLREIKTLQSDIRNLLRNFPLGSTSERRFEFLLGKIERIEGALEQIKG